ncbi:universal stress protein [Cryomorpha ignava]|uniref:Universal stress protein n=1 Tax=Cryomorpha ignava TaxID=101383 RepID=A0A7K3WML9_9FLAO|nr:universal stress protein [Cryomorpha ignava]NEN22251.1 universal stress protein [Cryomorpha ignava]
MNHLFVFVDFSETSILAFNQALAIAEYKGSKISICHIVANLTKEIQAAVELKLKPFIETAQKKGVKLDSVIVEGELFETAKSVVTRLKPDLIVVGTHGRDGIHLRLFGSAIHKLVREVPAPSLVLGKTCSIMRSGFRKVLVPASSQPAYLIQVERACELLAPDGEITLFAIENANFPVDNASMVNMDNARELLEARNVKWKYVEVQAKPHQTGMAAQTLEYILSEKIEMIAIAAEIAERFRHFGKLDKEAILLNEDGIKVLCVNRQLV